LKPSRSGTDQPAWTRPRVLPAALRAAVRGSPPTWTRVSSGFPVGGPVRLSTSAANYCSTRLTATAAIRLHAIQPPAKRWPAHTWPSTGASGMADGHTRSRQALPKMLSTCRDVVIGVTCHPLNHSSTTSAGNGLAAAGHDRSCGPVLAGGSNPPGAADSKAPMGIANVILARLKPAWHCRADRTGRSQSLASSSIAHRTDRLCWTTARYTDPVEASVAHQARAVPQVR
jgi:hypothetical protein